jgi:hypothetical protein
MDRSRTTALLIGMLDFVFSLAAIGLFLRFLFRLFGANPSSPFVDFLYSSTAPLLSPFEGIFRSYTIERGYVIEFSTLIALVMYMLIAWLFVALVSFVYEQTLPRKVGRR